MQQQLQIAKYSRFPSNSKFLAQRLHRIVPHIYLDVGNAHLGASANETPRKGETNALGPSSHDGPLVLHRERHLDGLNPPRLLPGHCLEFRLFLT